MNTKKGNKLHFNWEKSIFPILSFEFDEKEQPFNPEFMGTGFFAVIAGMPVIVSAKHVFAIFKDTQRRPCIATRYGKNDVLPLAGAIIEHKEIDIAFCLLKQDFYNKNKDEFVPIQLKFEQLDIGDDVFTFGYPNSCAIIDDFSNEKVLNIDQIYFKGYVCNVLDMTEHGGTKQTYLLNFPSILGSSGSPLLVIRDRRIVCVGIIFKEHKIEYGTDVYIFGLAYNAEPLLSCDELLKGVTNKQGK